MREVPSFIRYYYRPASNREVLSWSYGLVKAPRNRHSQHWKDTLGTLDDPRIFGSLTDYACVCGKYRGSDKKGMICDICGVKITISDDARRTRFGHLALPVAIHHPLGDPSDMLEVYPVLPAVFLESSGGAALGNLYDRIVEANSVSDVDTVCGVVEQIVDFLVPMVTEAQQWNLRETDTLARGLALERREVVQGFR